MGSTKDFRYKEDESMRRANLLMVSVALILVLATGVAVAATINGTAKDDFLRGTDGPDRIGARDGNDEVRALAGADKVFGGTGRDTLYGKEDGDLIVGGRGNDRLDGGTGNDTLKSHFDGNADNLTCNQGNDTAFVEVNDVIDDKKTGDLVATALNNTTAPVTSCETLKVYVTEDLVVTIRLGEITGVVGGTLADVEDELIDLGFISIG
jgi:Ca2+-binding RTX toxin-like protein